MKTCIFTLIKNEHEYLEHWIKYHIDYIGIDHIFIFEDIDSKSHKEICGKFKGEQVTLKSALDIFPEEHQKNGIRLNKRRGQDTQNIIYRVGLEYIKNNYDYDWCFCLDVDEFLSFYGDDVKEFIKRYEKYDAIVIKWWNYGANGWVHKPDYSKIRLMDAYKKQCGNIELDEKLDYMAKVCYNLKRYTRNNFIDMHTPGNCRFKTADQYYGRILHFITKSFEEYVNKIVLRGMCHIGHRKIEDFFVYNKDMLDKKEELMKMADEIIKEKMVYKIVIVIPCYNQGKYVADAIKSLIGQTYVHWKCVVINDGSTDDSDKVIREAIADDDRFVYINQENKGVAASRNLGARMFKSEYLMFLDADDMLDRTYLEKGIVFMDEHKEYTMFHAKAKMIGQNNYPKYLHGWKFRYPYFLLQCTCYITNIQRREAFDATDGFDPNLEWMEDWEYLIRLLDGDKKVYNSDEFLFIYRYHPDSRSTSNHTEEDARKIRTIIYNKNKEIYDRNIKSLPERWKE